MNKNDFYKELMTTYALDPEKIRMNAVKQAKKPAWQKTAESCWKPVAGAAAVIAVTFAGITLANQSSAPDITVDHNEVLSASQRLFEAEQDYYNLSSEQDSVNMYVTFLEPVSYNEILMFLSTVGDLGDFEICSLYLKDVEAPETNVIGYAAEHSAEKTAVAAKISLPSSFHRDIQDLSIVYLAELGSDEINDSTFTPIAVEDGDPLNGDYLNSITTPVTLAPPVTTTPFSFDAVTEVPVTDNPVIGDSHSDSDTTLPPATETTTSEEELIEPDEEEELIEPDEEEYDEPDSTTVPTTETPAESTTYSGTNGGLLTEYYDLNVENSLETHIIGDNAVILTKTNAYFYTLGGFASSQYSEIIPIDNPKLAYKNEKTVILSGCGSDGARTILSVIDLEANTILTYDACANIGENEIGTVQYSPQNGKFYLTAVSAESTFVYEVSAYGAITFRPLFEIEVPVSLVGFKNDILYFTYVENAEFTRLYSFNCINGESHEILAVNGMAKIKRGSDFESFAIKSAADDLSFIYDVNLGMLVPAEFDKTIAVITYENETYFTWNGIVYKIDPTSGIIEANADIVFEKTPEELFLVNEITSEKVVVIKKDKNMW